METEKQELLEFSKRWDEAMVSNDADEIAKFMSEDWKIVGSDGITSKSSFLQFISSGIFVSRGTSAGTYNGENFSFYEWSTSIFIKAEGTWRCVLTMLTPATNSK